MEASTQEEILRYLLDEVGGDWFLTGGGLVRMSFDASRGTEDLDLVKISHSEQSDDSAKQMLYRWLIDRGFGPEWINSAVEPFVREVSDWQKETVLARTGEKGRLFRPTITLFVYLKLRRGTEIDIGDIQKAAQKCAEPFDEKLLLSWGNPKVAERYQKQAPQLGLKSEPLSS